MESSPKVLKSFCTTNEAAQTLGVSVRTVQLWTEAGLLQAWKTDGGHRRITRESVENLLASKPRPMHGREAHGGENLTILVVDDEPSLLRLYEQNMRRWPMKPAVITARNGMEALVKLGSVRPDLLVTDLRMPDLDGFKMLQSLRTFTELAGMSTVVVTGLDSVDIDAGGGVPDGIPVLPKPIPFDRLRDIAIVIADRKLRKSSGTDVFNTLLPVQ